MTAQISPMHLSGSAKTDPKHTLVASAAVAALFGWAEPRLRRMTAELWPKSSPTRSPPSSAYRSSETTTGKSVRREKVHNGS